MARLNVLAWNTYAANDDDNVIAALSTWAFRYDPDIIALSEAMTHGDALAEWAHRHGYALIQERPLRSRKSNKVVDDTGDVAILVAPHVTVRRDWVAVMRHLWMVYSHHRWHKPHRYQVAAIKVRGHQWRVRASHWPTNGMHGGNKQAWLESFHRSRGWLSRSTSPSIDVGDLNEKRETLSTLLGPKFHVCGSGIDVAITRNVANCQLTELGKGGGDHHGRFYRFTA